MVAPENAQKQDAKCKIDLSNKLHEYEDVFSDTPGEIKDYGYYCFEG